MNVRRGDPRLRPTKPSRAGRVLARCTSCGAEARADGSGKPVTLAHADGCSELCACYHGCDPGVPDVLHQHADDPCVLHPDRPVAGTAKYLDALADVR